MSRQQPSSPDFNLSSSSARESPIDQRGDISERPSTSSRYRRSEGSEGYPSWLPKRPLHPPPTSTFQSHAGMRDSTASEQFFGGRKPTPRSVRIVNLQDPSAAEKDPHVRRETTDMTRVSNAYHPRVWSRATAPGMSPTLFSSGSPFFPQPRFKSPGLHLQLLQNPSIKSRIAFYLLPLVVFAHIPLQTFFDFNAVFILLQVTKFPNAEAPGVPGSGRNWALGAAAYVACWFTWIFVIFVVYEIIYSFTRRWRVKRPLIMPIYLSSPAFNLAAMSSYSNFCFLQQIRYAAFVGDKGSLRDGLAETFWFYSQNLPTVALLLPRAGLSLALLLSFSSPQPGAIALADTGTSSRDGTYFRSDGALTGYAYGVLIANAAWTAWRFLVLFTSWIGLWVLSGHGCAGLCGPRFRWEEEEAAEKTMSGYDDTGSEIDALPWNWKEATRVRIQEAYDFCLTVKPPRWSVGKRETSDGGELLGPTPASVAQFEGMEQVLAAIGFPSSPPPARRGVLSEDLFAAPKHDTPEPRTMTSPEFGDIIPKVVKRPSKEQPIAGPSAPLMALPYSFTGYGAQVSSKDRVPFPPSPEPSGQRDDTEEEVGDEEEEGEVVEGEEGEAGNAPSSGRASGSMSSLGHPILSRYPFQFRRPQHGHSPSIEAPSRISANSQSNTASSPSRVSHSTGNRESTESQSPRSYGGSSGMASPLSQVSGIPMPPRHPQQGRSRARAGTVPSVVQVSPASIAFPRARARTRTDSSVADTFSGPELYSYEAGDVDDDEEEEEEEREEERVMDQPEPEGPHEAAETDDVVGLLSHSAAVSPRSSLYNLRHRASNMSPHRRSHGSRSGSNSRSNSQSGSASSRSRTGSMSVVRSRAQSLVQSIGAASRSSVEMVQAMRLRANSSMARLEEDMPDPSDRGTHSRSGSGSDAVVSGSEGHTFGHPLRTQWPREEEVPEQLEEEEPPSPEHRESRPQADLPVPASSSEQPSDQTTSRWPEPGTETPAESSRDTEAVRSDDGSQPDISTAPPSFITAPTSMEGVTESSGRTLSSWGRASGQHMLDRPGYGGPA